MVLSKPGVEDCLVFGVPDERFGERVCALVQPASGVTLDTTVLLAALRDKNIAGAALDVFNQEPLPPDHPFWDFKNVIITTHQGGFCDTYVDLAMPILEHNMRCFLKGELKGMINVARPAA